LQRHIIKIVSAVYSGTLWPQQSKYREINILETLIFADFEQG